MDRILEPELMDDDAQSRAYAKADFSASNQRFVDGLVGAFPSSLRRVVDLGCGPADVVLRLARAVQDASITAVDGSAPMIALARRAVRAAGVDSRVTLLEAKLPRLPLDAQAFDAVLSKDLLHHLANPSVLWQEVMRLGRPGAAVYVMDLIRPDTPEAARGIVEAVAASEDAILRQDFFNSLCAAFTVDEVAAQLQATGLNQLALTRSGDRHLLVQGRL
jgi:SAM-dependent methyltransferase